jgi:hypothetical protein
LYLVYSQIKPCETFLMNLWIMGLKSRRIYRKHSIATVNN